MRAVFAVVLLLLLAAPVAAQSGRRPKGRTTPPEMVPLPTETRPVEPEPEEAPRATMAATRWIASIDVTASTADYVIREASKLLRAEGGIVVMASSKDTPRKEAEELAKAATTEYMLFVDFDTDARRSGNYDRPEDARQQLVAEYWVYEPKSGKVLVHGRLGFTAGGVGIVSKGGTMPRFPGQGRQAGGLTPAQCGVQIARHILHVFSSRPMIPTTTR